MAPEVHYSYKAERDLEKTIDYTVNKWGAQQADEYITGLDTLAQQLAESPFMGVSNILGSVGLFAFPYKSHTLYYLKTDTGISMVRVLHQSMLPEKYL